jgi:hypothetical protein
MKAEVVIDDNVGDGSEFTWKISSRDDHNHLKRGRMCIYVRAKLATR